MNSSSTAVAAQNEDCPQTFIVDQPAGGTLAMHRSFLCGQWTPKKQHLWITATK